MEFMLKRLTELNGNRNHGRVEFPKGSPAKVSLLRFAWQLPDKGKGPSCLRFGWRLYHSHSFFILRPCSHPLYACLCARIDTGPPSLDELIRLTLVQDHSEVQ